MCKLSISAVPEKDNCCNNDPSNLMNSTWTIFYIIDVFDTKFNSKIGAKFCHKLPPSLVPPAPLKARG